MGVMMPNQLKRGPKPPRRGLSRPPFRTRAELTDDVKRLTNNLQAQQAGFTSLSRFSKEIMSQNRKLDKLARRLNQALRKIAAMDNSKAFSPSQISKIIDLIINSAKPLDGRTLKADISMPHRHPRKKSTMKTPESKRSKKR